MLRRSWVNVQSRPVDGGIDRFTSADLDDLGLGRPLERWPTRAIVAEFGRAKVEGEMLLGALDWPEALTALTHAMSLHSGAEAPDQLRAMSTMIGMLAHMTPDTKDRAALHNLQRRRTAYASYPTPPVIGRVIARYVARHLPDHELPLRVVDPTIEGAPLLLECALELASRPTVELLGIDRSAAVHQATGAMFARGQAAIGLKKPTILHGDCFDLLEAIGPFDAVVNNPPWGERSRNGLGEITGLADPYTHFVGRALDMLKPGGAFGLILPGQAITGASAQKMRRELAETCQLDVVAVLPKHCFPRATVRSVLLLGRKRLAAGEPLRILLVRYPAGDLAKPSPPASTLLLPALPTDGASWLACSATNDESISYRRTVKLGELVDVRAGIVPYRAGRGVPRQSAKTLGSRPFTFSERTPGTLPVLRGRQIRPLYCLDSIEHVLLGPHLAYSGDHKATAWQPRVFVRELCSRDGRLVAAPAPPGAVPRYGVFALLLSEEVDPLVVSAILNSSAISRIVRARCDGLFRESFNRIRSGDLRRFPMPRAIITDPVWNDQIRSLCEAYLATTGTTERRTAIERIDRVIDAAYQHVVDMAA